MDEARVGPLAFARACATGMRRAPLLRKGMHDGNERSMATQVLVLPGVKKA
jgi:hypothetical protein